MNEALDSEPGTTTAELMRANDFPVDEVEPAEESSISRHMIWIQGAPWWIVSVLLHGLAFALMSLVSAALILPEAPEPVVMVTELAARMNTQEEKIQKPEDKRQILQSDHDTPPTDPKSTEASDVVVPPDVLAKAEIGDHFETINLDRPDTQSAFGNEDAKMFHNPKEKADDAAGGGGVGGTTLDDMIGSTGGGSAGTGGGWGGGNGTGIGVGDGAGKGSFGNRNGGGRKLMVKRHGGSKATEDAVDAALDWLARHQEADGRWSTKKTEGTTGDWDPGVSGLAVLAFLGAGHTEKVGKYKENVKRGVAWIISQQAADGGIGGDALFKEHHGGYAYHHAICGLALAEAAGMAMIPATKEAAQKAIVYTCNYHKTGDGSERLGWRYSPGAPGDLSATGWFVMQLKSAKIAGLHVDTQSFEGAMVFLDKCEEKPANVKIEDSGYDDGRHRYGYTGPGAMVNTTAIGMLCRMFLGWKPSEFQGAAAWLLRTNLPEWRADLGQANGGGWPMYYMYYGTLTLFQVGGDQWKQWNEALKKTLVTNQCKDGDKRGSWDPFPGGWEAKAGRAYTTALGALSLEVYYRYMALKR